MRKGKGKDVMEQDMESVVHAHNCESSLPLSTTSYAAALWLIIPASACTCLDWNLS